MIGFWEEDVVAWIKGIGDAGKRGNRNESNEGKLDVQVTAYVQDGRIVLALGNFTDELQQVQLKIDWNKLDLDPEQVRLYAPAIENYQPRRVFEKNDWITLPPKQGWLLVVE